MSARAHGVMARRPASRVAVALARDGNGIALHGATVENVGLGLVLRGVGPVSAADRITFTPR